MGLGFPQDDRHCKACIRHAWSLVRSAQDCHAPRRVKRGSAEARRRAGHVARLFATPQQRKWRRSLCVQSPEPHKGSVGPELRHSGQTATRRPGDSPDQAFTSPFDLPRTSMKPANQAPGRSIHLPHAARSSHDAASCGGARQ